MRHERWLWAVLLAAAGALRAQDKPEPAKPAKPAVEYVEGRGMLFRSPDGLFEASLGFNLQVRFRTSISMRPPAAPTRTSFGSAASSSSLRGSPSIPA